MVLGGSSRFLDVCQGFWMFFKVPGGLSRFLEVPKGSWMSSVLSEQLTRTFRVFVYQGSPFPS